MELEQDSRKVKRQDELDYKTVLKRKVELALTYVNSKNAPMFVRSLELSLLFDIPGLPLKTEIEEIKKELDKAIKEYKVKKSRELRRKYGIDALGIPVQVQFKIDILSSYWRTYLRELIGLMALHGLLIEPQQFVEEGESD